MLRPGGRFIASDWLRGGGTEYSAQMLEFFRLEGIAYNMAGSRGKRGRVCPSAGFDQVEIRDRHGWYLDLAQRDSRPWKEPLNAVIVHRIGLAARSALHR